MIVFVMLASVAISAAATGILLRLGTRLTRLDVPNDRSLHLRPTPRTGGLGILGAMLLCGAPAAVAIGAPVHWLWIAAGALLVASVSFQDDRRNVHPVVRLLVHLVAATLAILGPGWSFISSIGWPAPLTAALLIAGVAWSTNLYNFMDGMDGFAGGMAVIGFGTYAFLAWLGHAPAMAAMCGSISAGAVGFLAFNFPPARLFMGDAGSTTLGFLAAMLGLLGVHDHLWTWPVPILVFSPFVVDATVTLARRGLAGERLWRAHRAHYYQRLVQAGWGHRRTVLFEYAVMLACGATAIAAQLSVAPPWPLILSGWVVFYVVSIGLVHGVERRFSVSRPRRSGG